MTGAPFDGSDLARRVHREVVEHGDRFDAALRVRVSDAVRREAPLLPGATVAELTARITSLVTGLGALEPLVSDPAVTDVLVNGPGPIWVERAGSLERTDVVVDAATIAHLIERVIAPLGLRIDRQQPYVDARLPDGSRVNAVIPPLAVDGPYLTIRRFGTCRRDLEAVCGPVVADLLRAAVAGGANIVVSGGTGAGKTTLLNTLAAEIPSHERVITIEDAAELRLPGDHVVRLEARPANADGVGEVRIRDLVRNALRMRPDRLVVGEVRGAETLDMLQAMNTGHDGSMSTCHANTPEDALRRLETMVLMGDVDLPLAAIREQLHAAIDLVVHIARTPAGRRITEVAEVTRPGSTERVRSLSDGQTVSATPRRPPRRVRA
jgi:pilus assembly protein CpaF